MFDFLKKKKEPAQLCISTDIHCHLVPGVDDGAKDAFVAADIIERMQALGIKRIIASPHVAQDTFENTPEGLDTALAELKAELISRGMDIDISRSAEYRLDDFSLSQIDGGEASLLPNSHILVENSFMQEPWGLEQILFNLQLKGLKPILAHPERYFYYHKNLKILNCEFDTDAPLKGGYSYGIVFKGNKNSAGKPMTLTLTNCGSVDADNCTVERKTEVKAELGLN